MNIAEWSIRNNVTCLVLVILLIGGGIFSYESLGRLEDPEFTIKEALITTEYPGATPQEVEEEVTEKIETAIQELSQLDEIRSLSIAGKSIITAEMRDKYDKNTLPQVWDELRRKVGDVQSLLPPGVKPSIVNDDYGDVYGVLIAITGDGYTYKDLKDYADFLKRELLLVDDVAKVILWGQQQEQVFVEISRARMAQLGIGMDEIYKTLAAQNIVVDSGSIKVGTEYIRISPTGEIDSVDEISNLMIHGKTVDKVIYLKDIATVTRGYITPPNTLLRYNGKPAIALGVSTVSGGNVVTMGRGLEQRVKELLPQTPVGIHLDYIYFQAEGVEKSVNSFVINLLEALAIVMLVLMLFMGMRSGLLIGTVLLLTICATFVFMKIYGIDLQRISLGALIIALGMLVDNAIVVTEGIMIRIQAGKDRLESAKIVVAQSMWPLFGATVVAVLAFSAIGLSQDSTGEYSRSLFQVMLISLGLSWLIAITITPLFCVMFVEVKKGKGAHDDPYQGFLFQLYRGFLSTCLRFRWLTIAVLLALLALAIYCFGLLEDSFFPNSTNPQFMVHFWLPEGTDIRVTSKQVGEVEKYVLGLDGVKNVSTYVGAGPPRFMLVVQPEKSYTSYAMLLVTVKDYRLIDKMMKEIHDYISTNFLDANPKLEKIRLGPGGGFAIEARFSGPDPNVLRELAEQAQAVMRADGGLYSIRNDWRERVKVIRPQFAEAQARRAGISRADVADALQTEFSGRHVGIYRESDTLLPIVSRRPKSERTGIDNIYSVQVWSDVSKKTVPLLQVVTDFETDWEDAVVHRRDKRRTITAQGDQKTGNSSVVFNRIRAKIEAIPLPVGYEFAWGGEYEDSVDAQQGLAASLPLTLLLMILVVIALFNALRQPLIIWLTVPLAIIGVSFGLLATGNSFDFMAILGFLSLVGMLIKNAIVLIDEIDGQIRTGKDKFEAILDSSVSRMRPVTMAAFTTVLGMIPLLQDVFFVAMAVTIMSGLSFATLLTLIVVPVLYAIFFRIPTPSHMERPS